MHAVGEVAAAAAAAAPVTCDHTAAEYYQVLRRTDRRRIAKRSCACHVCVLQEELGSATHALATMRYVFLTYFQARDDKCTNNDQE